MKLQVSEDHKHLQIIVTLTINKSELHGIQVPRFEEPESISTSLSNIARIVEKIEQNQTIENWMVDG